MRVTIPLSTRDVTQPTTWNRFSFPAHGLHHFGPAVRATAPVNMHTVALFIMVFAFLGAFVIWIYMYKTRSPNEYV